MGEDEIHKLTLMGRLQRARTELLVRALFPLINHFKIVASSHQLEVE